MQDNELILRDSGDGDLDEEENLIISTNLNGLVAEIVVPETTEGGSLAIMATYSSSDPKKSGLGAYIGAPDITEPGTYHWPLQVPNDFDVVTLTLTPSEGCNCGEVEVAVVPAGRYDGSWAGASVSV